MFWEYCRSVAGIVLTSIASLPSNCPTVQVFALQLFFPLQSQMCFVMHCLYLAPQLPWVPTDSMANLLNYRFSLSIY